MQNSFWNDYQNSATICCLNESDNLMYLGLGLNGEADELTEPGADIKKEMGDCLWYVSQVARKLGIKMQTVACWCQDIPDRSMASIHLNKIAGRIAERIKKRRRDQAEIKETVIILLGQYMACVRQIGFHHNISLEQAASTNIEKLTSRMNRKKLGGEGDDR